MGGGISFSSSDFSVEGTNEALSELGLTSTSTSDDSDQGFKFFGGYQFSEYFGAELSYIDTGDMTANTTITFPFNGTVETQHETTGVNLSITGRYLLTRDLSVQARVGAFMWDSDTSVNALFPQQTNETKTSDDDTDISFGATAAYRLNNNMQVRLDWDHLPTSAQTDVDYDLFSINLQYQF